MKYNDNAFAFEWTLKQGESNIGWWKMFWKEGKETVVETGMDMDEFMEYLFQFDTSVVNVIYVKNLNYFHIILSAYAGYDEGKSTIGFKEGKENVMRLFLKDISWIEFRNWDNFFEEEECGIAFLDHLDYCREKFNTGYKKKLGLGKHFIFTVRRDLWNDIANKYKFFSMRNKRLRDEMLPQSEEEFALYQEVYKGSYCFVNPVFVNTTVPRVNCYDISSSHLGLMVRKGYPTSRATKVETIEQMKYVLEHDFCFIGRFTLKGIEPRYNMPFDLTQFGYCEKDGTWHVILTDVHLNVFKKLFKIKRVSVEELFYFKKGFLDAEYAKMIYELYEIKQHAKKTSDPFLKYIFKLRAELVFGMSIKNPFYDIEAIYNEELNCFEPIQVDFDFDKVLDTMKNRNSLPFQIGVWTAAHSFAEEIDTILGIGLDKVVYGDTDSVKYAGESDFIKKHNDAIIREEKYISVKRNFSVESNMGKWLEEKKCKKFKAIGQKWYLAQIDNEIVPTAAGADGKVLEEWAKETRFPFATFGKNMSVKGLFRSARIDKENCCIITGTQDVINEAVRREMEQKMEVIK